MADFIWPAEVGWPPPEQILLNYDVIPPAASVTTDQVVLHTFVPRTYGGIRFVNVTQPAQTALAAPPKEDPPQ